MAPRKKKQTPPPAPLGTFTPADFERAKARAGKRGIVLDSLLIVQAVEDFRTTRNTPRIYLRDPFGRAI